MVKVDIACGQSCKEGYIGVDIAPVNGVDIVHDLNVYPWPFEDESVDELHCSHYVEHIKHDDVLTEIKEVLKECTSFDEFKNKISDMEQPKDGFIKFMNEVDRIMKKGGVATISAPYVTHTRAFGDPTHTRYIHDMSFYYFNKEWRDLNKLDHYDIEGDFDVKFSYAIGDELTLKSNEVRQKAFNEDWNSITDVIVELTKR